MFQDVLSYIHNCANMFVFLVDLMEMVNRRKHKPPTRSLTSKGMRKQIMWTIEKMESVKVTIA